MPTPNKLEQLNQTLTELADPERAKNSAWFFKTGKGEYGEGDKFLGIKVPELRKLSRQYKSLSLLEIKSLLSSAWHEKRLLAVFILVLQYKKAKDEEQTTIYNFYLKNRKHINNWDIVDSSSRYIVGAYLENKDKTLLYDYAKNGNLWERRIAVLATFWYVPKHQFTPSLKLANMLLNDPEDLMHKAVGWMLREIGKADKSILDQFLTQHCKTMPRTMLRYAIEKHEPAERKKFLNGDI